MRWRDFTLKNLKMPKSVFKKPQKFNANPPKIPFFFFL
ncbi:hypothetical protein HPHPH1_0971 [Helicobacter pylori Hp H-1]|uniref:Uncharacterized protein n=1 Tax=Helicobacter pylori Hp H-1 TaxID=992058 RepID=M7SLF8_HELPX|nr:hypothetical protein HPHPH1_0971 [Helicobacter pylori Hp H-1]